MSFQPRHASFELSKAPIFIKAFMTKALRSRAVTGPTNKLYIGKEHISFTPALFSNLRQWRVHIHKDLVLNHCIELPIKTAGLENEAILYELDKKTPFSENELVVLKKVHTLENAQRVQIAAFPKSILDQAFQKFGKKRHFADEFVLTANDENETGYMRVSQSRQSRFLFQPGNFITLVSAVTFLIACWLFATSQEKRFEAEVAQVDANITAQKEKIADVRKQILLIEEKQKNFGELELRLNPRPTLNQFLSQLSQYEFTNTKIEALRAQKDQFQIAITAPDAIETLAKLKALMPNFDIAIEGAISANRVGEGEKFNLVFRELN